MVESILWSGVLRAAQALIQAVPTLLVGLVVAGIFRRFLGPANTRRLFGTGTRRELWQAWLIGMLLPVCSLGVIPVARELRRAGVSPGAILAFALTAPLFNPVSLLYGLTLSEPTVVLVFAFASMIVVTAVGATLNRLLVVRDVEPPPDPPVSYGLRRIAAVAVVAAREVTGPTAGYVALGLLGVGVLGMALPPGSLQMTMEHSNPYAPLAMAGVAIPAYASPMTAMAQLGSMFQHANSPGAAFVLLTLGAGVNLGVVAWVLRNYGVGRGLAWLGLLGASIIGVAYAIETPLYPSAIAPPGHTHAFDIYCRAFDSGHSHAGPLVVARLREDVQPFERVGLIILGSMAVAGLLLRLLDRRWSIEDWLEREPRPSGTAPSWHQASVPAPVLGVVALLGLIAVSVVGCYLYYPDPREVFEEMSILKGEVLTAAMSGDRKHAEHFLPVWAEWTRRLEVGSFLRQGSLSPYRKAKTKLFRDRLELLKHAIEEGDREESREYVVLVSLAYGRLRGAFLDRR